MDACLDYADNSVYAEQFLPAVESVSFFENNILKLIKSRMKYIPSESRLHSCFDMKMNEFEKKTDWKTIGQSLFEVRISRSGRTEKIA